MVISLVFPGNHNLERGGKFFQILIIRDLY
jgi:hypothetical protein